MKRYLHRAFIVFSRIGPAIGFVFLTATFAQQTNNGFAGASVSIAFQNGGTEVAGQGVSIAFQNASADVIGQGVSIAFAENINADVAVTISASASSISIKGSLAYTITVTNNGPSHEVGFTVIDNLPDGVIFGSFSTSQGTCFGGRKFSCALGTIPQNAKATVTLVVLPAKSGEVTNTVTVTTNGLDPNLINNTAAITTTILPDLAPLAKGTLYGDIDPSLPTIVLTHGLSDKSDYSDVEHKLWTGKETDEHARGARTLLAGKLKELNRNVNILQYVWDEAFQVSDVPDRVEYVIGRTGANNAGVYLANELLKRLTPTYRQKIHFVGHSLGTIVNSYAAERFLMNASQVTEAQFTALDRPHHVNKIPDMNLLPGTILSGDGFEKEFGFDSTFFASRFSSLKSRSNLKLRVDNYYTYSGFTGVGDLAIRTDGITFYNKQLVSPNDVGGKFFRKEAIVGFDNNHSGVQQWYRLTINPDLYKDSFGKPICNGANFNRPEGWNSSLNPCQIGWYWSLNGVDPASFPNVNEITSPPKMIDKTIAVSGFKNIQGCQQQTNSISCQESSITATARTNKAVGSVNNAIPSANAFATINIDLPVDVNYLTFEYKFSNVGDGDYAALFIGNNSIWSLAAANFTENDFVSSGPIPISGYKGNITITLALFGVGAANAIVEFRNFAGISLNSPPVFERLEDFTIESGNTLTFNASARDENGDSITFSLSDAPAGATINPSTGAFNWTPSALQFGAFSFKVRVTDSSVDQLFSEQTVKILVLDTAGYEADVAPRPSGNKNGDVTIADWVLLGRFVAGLDTAEIGSEFQRVDCAPRDTLGDGKITIADWVQAGRYAAGLDGIVSVGGAYAPLDSLFVDNSPESQATFGSIVRVRNTQFLRGQISSLQIDLEAQGGENGLAFSLNFDPKALNFVDATLGDGANGAALQVNASQATNGKLGIALALPAGQSFVLGTRPLLKLRFIPMGGDSTVSTQVSFSDQLIPREVADVNAAAVPNVSYTSATITITGKTVATVSAASYLNGEMAADSIASAFGTGLATMTTGAVSLPLPTTLGGTSVRVKDARGVERIAPLFFVSPTQINYQIPAGTADGLASLTITNGAGEVTAGLLSIARVAPGLFAADASGKGWAAAEVVSVASNGSQTLSPVAHFDVTQNKFVAVPIDVQTNVAVLVLYGTGIRQRSDLAQVKVKIGGIEAVVEYAGTQPGYVGLDQINAIIPRSLSGRGEVSIEVIVDGTSANLVKVFIQ